MEKQTKAEKQENELVAAIADEASKLNGPTSPASEVIPPKMKARLDQIQAGISEMHAIAAERDEAIERAEKAEKEIINLLNHAEQRAEGERLRLAEVSDKAISEARAAVAQQEVLQGEIDSLRLRLSMADTKIQQAQAEAAKFKTLALLLRASVDKVLDDVPT